MKRIIHWFASNPVAANLLMATLMIGGLLTLPALTQKEMPDIQIDQINVSVEYLGAAPEEVEEGVCVRIEEELEGVEGIDKIRSVATEGRCQVSLELLSSTDPAEALDDVKNKVDALDTLPEEAEKPVIAQVTIRRSVCDIALSGAVDERSLKILGQRVRDELAALPAITQAELTNARPYEISVEVSEETLRRHGLSFDQVADAVRRSSLDLPGGSIKTRAGEILLRSKAQAYWGEDFDRITVMTRADGSRITLRDVARVRDGFEDTDQTSTFDGDPAVMVRVFRVGDQDLIEISDAVKAYVEDASARLPEGVTMTLWRDSSSPLRGRLDTLFRNGRAGLLLVLGVLTIFLRPRLAFWVAFGVPVALLGAVWVLPVVGIGIESISTFGFIMVLGILVDDAIVIGENVHTHQQRGDDRLRAAISGAQEVSVPVIFGVLTTIAAFGPLFGVPGPMGQIMSVMATVVMLCLLFSLIESQLVLPAHLGHGRARAPGDSNGRLVRFARPIAAPWDRFQTWFARGLETLIRVHYRRGLERALAWRYATVASAILLLLWTLGLIASGRMQFSFFPPLQGEYVSAELTMPRGTPAHVTAEAVRYIESTAEQLRQELDSQYPLEGGSFVRHVQTSVGEQPFADAQGQNPANAGGAGRGTGGHLGEVTLELAPTEVRDLRTEEIANKWRDIAGPIPDAVQLVFLSSMFGMGDPINVQLQGPHVDHLREAATRLKAEVVQYPGVFDVADSFRAGKKEIKLKILPAAESLGLTQQDLARQVRQAFYGEEAQRVQRGRDDVKVMVRFPENERRSLGDLENMRIRTPAGDEVPFGSVARAELSRGFSDVRRSDRQRVVNVTGDVDRSQTTANQVLRDLEANVIPAIIADYPGMTYRLEGVMREQNRAFGSMIRWYTVALFAIFALLAIPLRSYFQPLLIMSVIPFGLVGAIVGHLLMGHKLSFMSVQGFVAASGVVVNASLVLVHYVNQRRLDGAGLEQAVCDAALARFRPIVLSALTTFIGLTPLMLERSAHAQFLVPMAISLAYGVLFATTVTLFVVPSGYLILEDLQNLVRRRRAEARPSIALDGLAARPEDRLRGDGLS